MTPTFTPSKGSPCDKAFTAIRIHGQRVSREAMAVALEVDEEEVDGLLGYPVRIGALAKTEDAGAVWFDFGDGTPLVPLIKPEPPLSKAPPPAPVPGDLVSQLARAGEAIEQAKKAEPAPKTYAPRIGSHVERAMRALKGKGWVPGAELAQAIELPPNVLQPCLERGLKAGVIVAEFPVGRIRKLFFILPDERTGPPPNNEAAVAATPDSAPETAAPAPPEPEIPQFLPSQRRVVPVDDDEILVGGFAPSVPTPRTHRIEFPIPNKASVKVELPPDFDARDWKCLQQLFTAYANRLAPVAS